MALKYQPPNLPLPKSKTAAFNEGFAQSGGFQAIANFPSTIAYFQALKADREMKARQQAMQERQFNAEYGTGQPSPMSYAPSGVPGNTLLPPQLSPTSNAMPMEETEEDRMARIGIKGYTAETGRLNAMKEREQALPKPTFFVDQDSKKMYDSMMREVPQIPPGSDVKLISRNRSPMADENYELRKQKYVVDLVSKFNSDKRVTKAEQSIDAARTIRDLANSGNPIAAGAIPTYSARMSGEVGALTEADKKPFGGSRAILTRIDASLKQMADGTLTPENKAFIVELTDLIEKRSNDNIIDAAKKRSKQYAKAGLVDEQELFEAFNPSMGDEPTPTAEVKRRTKDGKVAIFDANTKQFLRYE